MYKRIAIASSAVFLFIVLILYFSSPRSVKSFGPLSVGDRAPIVSESVFEYKHLYNLTYKFYIYAMEKGMSFCALGDCGMSGILVSCMGGWLSADGLSGDGGASDYGLKEEKVEAGKSSIIIVANQDKEIIGIYPNSRIRNIPYILKNYRNLFDEFDFCYNTQMPKRH